MPSSSTRRLKPKETNLFNQLKHIYYAHGSIQDNFQTSLRCHFHLKTHRQPRNQSPLCRVKPKVEWQEGWDHEAWRDGVRTRFRIYGPNDITRGGLWEGLVTQVLYFWRNQETWHVRRQSPRYKVCCPSMSYLGEFPKRTHRISPALSNNHLRATSNQCGPTTAWFAPQDRDVGDTEH